MASSLLVDILAYWKLDNNGSGGVSLVDSTGNGYTLGVDGTVLLGDQFQGSGSASFSGDGSYLFYGGLAPRTTFSVSLWFKQTEVLGSFDGFLSINGPGTGLDVINGTNTPFRVYSQATNTQVDSGTEPTFNDWNQFVITNDGTTITLYLNGVSVGSGDNNADTISGILFGLDVAGGGAGYFKGFVCESGQWDRSLSLVEVQDLYNGGVGNFYPFSTTPETQILYYNNAESDGDWGNILNWWKDNIFSVQATILPTPTNPVNVYNLVNQNTQGSDQCFCANGNFFSVNFGTGLTLQNSGVVNFYGSSVLSGNTTGGVSMHDSSYIDIPSTIGGNVTLRDASLNTGTINGNATVYYDGGQGTYPIGGTVLGTITYIGFNLGQTCYFNNAVNTFLGTTGNWWQDSAYTIPAGFVPDSTNDVVLNDVIAGITGAISESVTYKSIVSNSATFNGSLYNEFTIISTNGITATNSSFYSCTINANGTYTGCTLGSYEYGIVTIIGNVSLYNSYAINTHDSDLPGISLFTGIINAYYPTVISSGSVTGTLIRHGYTLFNTCIAHCNLNETSGTRTVLDLYEETFISGIVLSGSGVIGVDGTYTRASDGYTTFTGPNGNSIVWNSDPDVLLWELGSVTAYYQSADLSTWTSTNVAYDPAPTTDNQLTTPITVGYGPGLIDNAAKFNGDSLINPNPSVGNPYQLLVQFSISVWVNFPVVPTTPPQAIVGTGYDLYPNSLTINIQNGNLGLFVDATIGGQITGQSITANTWHNCVATCTTNSIKFYVDGVFQAQFATPLFYTAGVYLSQYLGGYQLTDNALVDEFNLFNIDLNQDQINQLYNGGAGSTFPFITGGGGGGTIDWARMLHLPFFFDSRKPSLARLLYLPWFINI